MHSILKSYLFKILQTCFFVESYEHYEMSHNQSTYYIKEGQIEMVKARWQTVSTNRCLLSLPLDTPLSVGHNGLGHWIGVNRGHLNLGIGVNYNNFTSKDNHGPLNEVMLMTLSLKYNRLSATS